MSAVHQLVHFFQWDPLMQLSLRPLIWYTSCCM